MGELGRVNTGVGGTVRSTGTTTSKNNGKGFCQEFCQMAESSADAQKVLPAALSEPNLKRTAIRVQEHSPSAHPSQRSDM